MEDWKFRRAHYEPARQFQSTPYRAGLRNPAETSKRFRQVRCNPGWEKRARKSAGDVHSGAGSMPVERWFPQYRRPESFLEVPPAPAVALHQFVGFFRSPTAGSVIRKISWRQRLQQIE